MIIIFRLSSTGQKNSPEGSNAAEVLEYIEKYAIGELYENNIQKGWFTFYCPQFSMKTMNL